MLTHYRTRRRIGAYLDGALDDGSARAAARHLEGCAACQREADEIRRLKALMSRAAVASASPDWTGLWPAIVRRIEDGRAAKPVEIQWRWPRAVWRPRVAFGGALAAAVLVFLSVWQAFGPPAVFEEGVVVNEARTEMPDATVMVYTPAERDLAVVWVFDRD